VLNLVDRLEKRAWLTRSKDQGVFRYAAAVQRQSIEAQLAADLVEEFVDGSTANLVMSLLGSKRISRPDIQRLKDLMDQVKSKSTRTKGEPE
jgi:BlaI family penicillinase repressor